jgi:hypothetical protein
MKFSTISLDIKLETQAEREALRQLVQYAKDNMTNLPSLCNSMAAAIITAIENTPQDE